MCSEKCKYYFKKTVTIHMTKEPVLLNISLFKGEKGLLLIFQIDKLTVIS